MNKPLSRKVYHFFHSGLEHHNQHMMQLFLNQKFSELDSIVVSTDPHDSVQEPSLYDVKLSNLKEYLSFIITKLQLSDIIVIHGLYTNWHYLIPIIRPAVAKNIVWDVWGDDFFSVKRLINSSKFSDKIRYQIRKFSVPRFGCIAGFPQDIRDVVSTFDFKGKTFEINHPLRKNINDLRSTPFDKKGDKSLKILIGNSGSRSNEHIRALELLRKNKDFDSFQLFCIFSTDADKAYEKEFKNYINNNQIKNITIILKVMEFEYFIEFVSQLDYFVMAHRRQQGVGTSNLSLLLGKAVFMDFNTSTAKYYHENNVKVFDVESLANIQKNVLPEKEAVGNSNKIKALFGIETVKSQWLKLITEYSIDN